MKKTHLLTFGYLLLFALQAVPVFTQTQSSGTVSLQGSIAPSVTLNVSSVRNPNNSDFLLTAIPLDGKRIRVELKGVGSVTNERPASLTVQLRSNSAYRMDAVLLESTSEIASSSLGLGNLTASGPRTSPTAVSNSQIPAPFTLKGDTSAASLSLLKQSQMILSGPRISLGGGPLASTNALNADLLFSVESKAGQPWSIYLELRIAPAVE